jgi:hypothetical protein
MSSTRTTEFKTTYDKFLLKLKIKRDVKEDKCALRKIIQKIADIQTLREMRNYAASLNEVKQSSSKEKLEYIGNIGIGAGAGAAAGLIVGCGISVLTQMKTPVYPLGGLWAGGVSGFFFSGYKAMRDDKLIWIIDALDQRECSLRYASPQTQEQGSVPEVKPRLRHRRSG